MKKQKRKPSVKSACPFCKKTMSIRGVYMHIKLTHPEYKGAENQADLEDANKIIEELLPELDSQAKKEAQAALTLNKKLLGYKSTLTK